MNFSMIVSEQTLTCHGLLITHNVYWNISVSGNTSVIGNCTSCKNGTCPRCAELNDNFIIRRTNRTTSLSVKKNWSQYHGATVTCSSFSNNEQTRCLLTTSEIINVTLENCRPTGRRTDIIFTMIVSEQTLTCHGLLMSHNVYWNISVSGNTSVIGKCTSCTNGTCPRCAELNDNFIIQRTNNTTSLSVKDNWSQYNGATVTCSKLSNNEQTQCVLNTSAKPQQNGMEKLKTSPTDRTTSVVVVTFLIVAVIIVVGLVIIIRQRNHKRLLDNSNTKKTDNDFEMLVNDLYEGFNTVSEIIESSNTHDGAIKTKRTISETESSSIVLDSHPLSQAIMGCQKPSSGDWEQNLKSSPKGVEDRARSTPIVSKNTRVTSGEGNISKGFWTANGRQVVDAAKRKARKDDDESPCDLRQETMRQNQGARAASSFQPAQHANVPSTQEAAADIKHLRTNEIVHVVRETDVSDTLENLQGYVLHGNLSGQTGVKTENDQSSLYENYPNNKEAVIVTDITSVHGETPVYGNYEGPSESTLYGNFDAQSGAAHNDRETGPRAGDLGGNRDAKAECAQFDTSRAAERSGRRLEAVSVTSTDAGDDDTYMNTYQATQA